MTIDIHAEERAKMLEIEKNGYPKRPPPERPKYSTLEIELAARTAHEVNRAYCIGLADYSQQPWESANKWQRQSARTGVLGVINGNTPEDSHELWAASRIAEGWTYGPVKDARTKTHPCLVRYSELPTAQRYKDTLFVTAIKGVLGL
jgi:hypothetical protein